MMRQFTYILALCGVLSSCFGEYPAYQEIEAVRLEVLESMVTIEGGTFMMGSESLSSDERPVHMVTVPTFQMMRAEITVAQYRACVNASVCSTPSSYYNWSRNPSDMEDHPINGVTWFNLMEFAAWVGARLPTEAEWEYAARGAGQDIIYPWGDQSATCQYAVMDDEDDGCGESRTWPVCSKPAGNTAQGLCDMAGNVGEWVQDKNHSDYSGAPSDGSGWCDDRDCPVNASDSNYRTDYNASVTWRVVRGGDYNSGRDTLKAAYRGGGLPPTSYRSFWGGRLARDLP
jgi:formylglycine-generating enzyme required for sulfatase activity